MRLPIRCRLPLQGVQVALEEDLRGNLIDQFFALPGVFARSMQRALGFTCCEALIPENDFDGRKYFGDLLAEPFRQNGGFSQCAVHIFRESDYDSAQLFVVQNRLEFADHVPGSLQGPKGMGEISEFVGYCETYPALSVIDA